MPLDRNSQNTVGLLPLVDIGHWSLREEEAEAYSRVQMAASMVGIVFRVRFRETAAGAPSDLCLEAQPYPIDGTKHIIMMGLWGGGEHLQGTVSKVTQLFPTAFFAQYFSLGIDCF